MPSFRSPVKFEQTKIPQAIKPEESPAHLRVLYQEVSGLKQQLAKAFAELERVKFDGSQSVTVVNRTGSGGGGTSTVLFLAFSYTVVAGVQTVPLPSPVAGTYIPTAQLINATGDPTGFRIDFSSRTSTGFSIDAGEAGTLFVTIAPNT